jgi:CDP-paratose 2-epimerase
MSVAIVTGSAGLVGSATCRLFHDKGLDVIGIDNDMRRAFFGDGASTIAVRDGLTASLSSYLHLNLDIRDPDAIEAVFARYGSSISVIVHTAAQPSHDWAARDPVTDFTVNANATLLLLQAAHKYCAEASFVYCSTNKVYGDTPNSLPLVERETRWEIAADHSYAAHGISETMSIDRSKHSLFGASKTAADLLVQEYGRYFGMRTVCFRAGCITGPGHRGAKLHGFLAYLARCVALDEPYVVIGYGGKQVRDNIDARDLAAAFWSYFEAPRVAEVYNIGGGRGRSCSVIEAIDLCEKVLGRRLRWSYQQEAREGDHIWWISDTRRFEQDYPDWKPAYGLPEIVGQIGEELIQRSGVAAKVV